MRHGLIVFIMLVFSVKGTSQKINSIVLTNTQQAEVFTDSLLRELKIQYPIYRTWQYTDKSGLYYCLLTESNDEVQTNGDTLNRNIKAINPKVTNDSFIKTWEISDHIVKDERGETTIWFWTKYTEFKDYDADGIIDPVIIYGSFGMNGYDDGRIKFIIFYRGQKIAIRHQNGVLDSERETQVDKTFYTLPLTLQSSIKQKMKLMDKNNQAIFPAGWQTAIKNKKLFFSERR